MVLVADGDVRLGASCLVRRVVLWKITPLLAARGHRVYTPTLTGLGERDHLAGNRVGLGTHIDDITDVLVFEDLDRVILTANSSAGAVITAVADRVPERIQQVVYVDAFVPADGERLLDIIPPDRRAAMEELAEQEGGGWLLPRMAAAPWEQFVPAAYQVTDEADLRWMLARLRPTPFGHFTEPVHLDGGEEAQPRHVYIRCRRVAEFGLRPVCSPRAIKFRLGLLPARQLARAAYHQPGCA